MSLVMLLLGCLGPAGRTLHVQEQQGRLGRCCCQLLGSAVTSVAGPPAELIDLVRLPLVLHMLVPRLCAYISYVHLVWAWGAQYTSCRYDCCAPSQHQGLAHAGPATCCENK